MTYPCKTHTTITDNNSQCVSNGEVDEKNLHIKARKNNVQLWVVGKLFIWKYL